jgi:hypothetical protein
MGDHSTRIPAIKRAGGLEDFQWAGGHRIILAGFCGRWVQGDESPERRLNPLSRIVRVAVTVIRQAMQTQ